MCYCTKSTHAGLKCCGHGCSAGEGLPLGIGCSQRQAPLCIAALCRRLMWKWTKLSTLSMREPGWPSQTWLQGAQLPNHWLASRCVAGSSRCRPEPAACCCMKQGYTLPGNMSASWPVAASWRAGVGCAACCQKSIMAGLPTAPTSTWWYQRHCSACGISKHMVIPPVRQRYQATGPVGTVCVVATGRPEQAQTVHLCGPRGLWCLHRTPSKSNPWSLPVNLLLRPHAAYSEVLWRAARTGSCPDFPACMLWPISLLAQND